MLVCAFRESGSTIGVTGEGLSDARSLSEASVGFTMGQDGCSAAKDHADVILMDDNFETVITSIPMVATFRTTCASSSNSR